MDGREWTEVNGMNGCKVGWQAWWWCTPDVFRRSEMRWADTWASSVGVCRRRRLNDDEIWPTGERSGQMRLETMEARHYLTTDSQSCSNLRPCVYIHSANFLLQRMFS